MKVINILVADDHPVVRQGIRQIFGAADDMRVAEEAANGRELLDLARTVEHDLVLLDLSMPEMSGLDVLKNLRTLRPKLPVLVLSMHPEDQYGKRVLKAGASGYMNKESAPEDLIEAVRKLLGGGRYVSPALAETLASDLSQDAGQAAHETLSDREFEVLRKLASGKTVSQIAEDLHLSVPTVSTYRARILEKMGMSTTAELMHYALRSHLVE